MEKGESEKTAREGLYLVAGGTGLIGRRVAADLTSRGRPVVVLTRDPERRAATAEASAAERPVDYRRGDVTDPDSVRNALTDVTTVVMAAQFAGHPVEQPKRGLTYDRVDRAGTENLVEAAKSAGVERFVYISGANVGKGRREPWFVAKEKAEASVAESGLDYFVFRPSWTYGPGDRSLSRIASIARRSPVVPVLGWKQQRVMPVWVGDVASAVVTAIRKAETGEIPWNQTFEVGGPDILTMKEVVETLVKVLGKRRLLVPAPKPLVKLASLPMLLLPRPPLSPRAVDFATGDAVVDNTAVRKELGLDPVSLDVGIHLYLT